MKIVDCSGGIEQEAFLSMEVYRDDGTAEQVDGALLPVRDVNVLVNGKLHMIMTCTPNQLVQAIMGQLFLSGVVSHVWNVVMANIGTAGRVVYVEVSRSSIARNGFKEISEKLQGALQGAKPGKSTLVPRKWNPDYLMTLSQSFDGSLQGATRLRGVHTCALAAGDELVYSGYDRNPEVAIDKAVGAAFMDGVALSECTFVTNAPLGIEGFARLVHAGITIVLTLACPTECDVRLARLCHITLADAPEPGRIRILHDALS